MIVEDHLKKCLARTSNKPWKATDNKLLPRCNHSPFGDFPGDYMPAKGNPVTVVQPINAAEVSIAVSGTCKYSLRFLFGLKSLAEVRQGFLLALKRLLH
jgi:hypothetical protein